MTCKGKSQTAEKTEQKMGPSPVEPTTLEEFAMAPWADPIQSFFESFEGFVYDPGATHAALFDQLVREQGWVVGSPEHKKALRRLEDAQFRQFDPSHGNPENPAADLHFGYDEEEELTPAEWAFISDYSEPAADQTLDRQLAEMSLERPVGHLDAFFADYPGFERDLTEPVSSQLNKLRKNERWWGERSHLWDHALRKYREALVLEFNALYGSDENDLENWHKIFSRIPQAKLPGTIDECKSVARTFKINLVDLVEAGAKGQRVLLVFDSKSALDSYTKKTKKYFPKRHASAGGLLSYLLQEMC